MVYLYHLYKCIQLFSVSRSTHKLRFFASFKLLFKIIIGIFNIIIIIVIMCRCMCAYVCDSGSMNDAHMQIRGPDYLLLLLHISRVFRPVYQDTFAFSFIFIFIRMCVCVHARVHIYMCINVCHVGETRWWCLSPCVCTYRQLWTT